MLFLAAVFFFFFVLVVQLCLFFEHPSGFPNVIINFDEDRISFLKFEITTNLIILISTTFREKSFLFKKKIFVRRIKGDRILPIY